METSLITTQVFNGDLAPTTANYVERYRFYARKTVENIILLAETAYEAELRLKPDDFSAFCSEVNMDPKGSTFRKMRQIGKLKDRFLPHLDKIPNNWTTVYELSKLKDSEFSGLIEKNIVHPEVTVDVIKKEVTSPGSVEAGTTETEYVGFGVLTKARTLEEAFHMEQDLQRIAAHYKVNVKILNENILERWKYFAQQQKLAA
jgi:hypothetical protein